MKRVIAIGMLLSACASVQHEAPTPVCEPAQAYQRGLRDGKIGHSNPHFLAACSADPTFLKKYYEGFAAAAEPKETYGPERELARVMPKAPSWVCEVEASAKIFTGVGSSENEALESARSNCGAHFQASACGQSECKQGL